MKKFIGLSIGSMFLLNSAFAADIPQKVKNELGAFLSKCVEMKDNRLQPKSECKERFVSKDGITNLDVSNVVAELYTDDHDVISGNVLIVNFTKWTDGPGGSINIEITKSDGHGKATAYADDYEYDDAGMLTALASISGAEIDGFSRKNLTKIEN